MMKDNKYSVCWLQICPFEISKERKFKPNRDIYPYRLCVFDKLNKRAIDVKTEKEYEYIYTSSIYFILEEAKRIEEGKRYAIMELDSTMFLVEQEDINHAIEIITKLQCGYKFEDGNLDSNEDYLRTVLAEEDEKAKVKTIKE